MALNLAHLNARQREAVLFPSGPLLILAGAGSGKTSTMAYRIAHLITERHLPASAILGLSFTNKAAGELKERVTKLVSEKAGRRATRGLTITTFHSLCARLLRAHAERLGFQKSFTIMDQNDQTDVLKQVLRNIRIDDRKFDPDAILFEIGQAKNRFLNPAEAERFFLESGRLAQDYALAAAASYGHYQEQLKVLNAMDFDDLIFYTVQLLETCEEVRDQYNYQFRHILVDEYQDTNAAQFKILKLLTQKQQNLCVVGDDDQSIYAWRGADPSHILEFGQHFPSAQVIALEQNYRSTTRILEAANHVIEKNKQRYPKKLWSERGEGKPINEVILEDDRGEAEFVAEEIRRRVQGMNGESGENRLWKDFVILYRSNSQSRVFEEALRRNGIPYRIVGGLSFLARKEVKNVLAYWKVIANTKDDASLRRIINWPARGIGKTSIEALGTHSFQNKLSIFEVLSEAPRLAPKSAVAVRGFQEMILSLAEKLASLPATAEALVPWAQESLAAIQAKRGVEEDSDDPIQAAKKWENVEELLHSIGQFRPEGLETEGFESTATQTEHAGSTGAESSPSSHLGTNQIGTEPNQAPGLAHLEGHPTGMDFLRAFLNRMTLDAQEAEKDEEKQNDLEKNQVTLLTLHGAKGLEYPVVFFVGMEEGFLPHKRTIDEATDFGEERRLCYVGITRAKDDLYLTRAKNRIRYGKPVPRLPSRFLEEIPKDLLLRDDQSSTPDLSSKEAVEKHETRVKNYLAEIRANLMKGGPS